MHGTAVNQQLFCKENTFLRSLVLQGFLAAPVLPQVKTYTMRLYNRIIDMSAMVVSPNMILTKQLSLLSFHNGDTSLMSSCFKCQSRPEKQKGYDKMQNPCSQSPKSSVPEPSSKAFPPLNWGEPSSLKLVHQPPSLIPIFHTRRKISGLQPDLGPLQVLGSPSQPSDPRPHCQPISCGV